MFFAVVLFALLRMDAAILVNPGIESTTSKSGSISAAGNPMGVGTMSGTGVKPGQLNAASGNFQPPPGLKTRIGFIPPVKGPSTLPNSLLNNSLPQLSLGPSSNTAQLAAAPGGNPMGLGTRSGTVVQPKELSSASGNVQPPPLTGLKTRSGLIPPAKGPSTQPNSPLSNVLPQLSLGPIPNTAPLTVGSGENPMGVRTRSDTVVQPQQLSSASGNVQPPLLTGLKTRSGLIPPAMGPSTLPNSLLNNSLPQLSLGPSSNTAPLAAGPGGNPTGLGTRSGTVVQPKELSSASGNVQPLPLTGLKTRSGFIPPAKGPSTQPNSPLSNVLPQLSLGPIPNTAPLTVESGGNPMGVRTRSDTVVQPQQLSSASGNVQPPPLTGLKTRSGLIPPANRPLTQPDSPPNNVLPQLSLVPSSNTAKLTAITGGNPMGVGTGSDTVVQPKQLSSASGNVQPPPLTGLKTRIGLISPANGPSTQPDSPPNNALPQLSSGFNTAPLAVRPRSRQQSSLPNSFVKSGVSGSANLPKEPSPPLTVGVAIPNQPSVRPGADRRPSSAGFGPIGVPTMIKPRDGRESIINEPLPHKPVQLNINGVQQASVPGLVMLGDQDRRLAEDIWRGNRKPNRYLIYITDWQRFKNRRNKQFKSYDDEEKQAFYNFVKKIHQKIQTDIAKKLGLQTVSPEKKVEANIREQLNNVLANVQGRIQNQRPPVGPYVRNPPVDSKYIKTNQAEPNQLPKKMVSVDTLLPRKPSSVDQNNGQSEKSSAANSQLVGKTVPNGDAKISI